MKKMKELCPKSYKKIEEMEPIKNAVRICSIQKKIQKNTEKSNLVQTI